MGIKSEHVLEKFLIIVIVVFILRLFLLLRFGRLLGNSLSLIRRLSMPVLVFVLFLFLIPFMLFLGIRIELMLGIID